MISGGDESGSGGGRRGGPDDLASGFTVDASAGARSSNDIMISGFGDAGSGGGDESRRTPAKSSDWSRLDVNPEPE